MNHGNRLAIVSPGYTPLRGGVADYAARLADGLVDAGCEVTVFTTRGLRHPTSRPGLHMRDLVPAWSFRFLWTILRAVRAAQPDAVLFQDAKEQPSRAYLLMLLPALIRFATGRPTYLIVHEVEGRRQQVQAALVRRVVVVDPAFIPIFIGGDRRIAHIRIGSNLPRPLGENRDGIRAAAGVQQEELAVGFFGFPAPHKGLGVLCDAVASLCAAGRPTRLVLIGNAASALAACMARCPCGPVGTADLDPAMAANALDAMDVNAFPFLGGARTRYGSLLAALQCGAPVVTTPGWGTTVPGMLEARPGDAADLAERIAEAANLPRCPDRRVVPSWADVACDFIRLVGLPVEAR